MTDRPIPVLTPAEMRAADNQAIASGIAGVTLMERAGWQVARIVRHYFPPQPTLVLCGPGNNGGDGFVAARLLSRWGWPITVELLGERDKLTGDARIVAQRWHGRTENLTPQSREGASLVIDALFGAGLARPLDGVALKVIEALNAQGTRLVAVDLPSGVNGATGAVMGVAPRALHTVTFAAPKPGHLLLPGRDLCGVLHVTEIGVSGLYGGNLWLNQPALWRAALPSLGLESHKYDRGHLLVAGGAELTGASRLAVWAGRRIGAGLTTLMVPKGLESAYRSEHPGTMVRSVVQWADMLADKRVTAVVLGPGLGVGASTRSLAAAALKSGKPLVLDADGLTSFAGDVVSLSGSKGPLILTPHDGEFQRIFALQGDRLTRARAAAEQVGAIMVLKGADCVVAAPDGRAAIANNAPPYLATAGSGDVLSGMIGGLLAQGMEPFLAACAAVWMHGEAASLFGPGLVAEDLADRLPQLLRQGFTMTNDGADGISLVSREKSVL